MQVVTVEKAMTSKGNISGWRAVEYRNVTGCEVIPSGTLCIQIKDNSIAIAAGFWREVETTSQEE